MKVERYQVWFTNDHTDLFEDFEDAYAFAIENNGIEIEKLIWNNEEDYSNYAMADDFITVWRK